MLDHLLIKVPGIIKRFYPNRIWDKSVFDKTLYLSFDDGPIPEITPWVLETLAKYQAEATFFCIGENVHKHPKQFQQLVDAKHSIGNHTYNHLNGWKTNTEKYIANIAKADKEINADLLRPPYGKMSSAQAKLLLKQGYKIVMWSILSQDYNPKVSKETCYNNVVKNAVSGDIIVFHDSLKAEANLRYALPKVLAYYKNKGYSFKRL